MQEAAFITEIMSTIQGEGKYIGTRQIFVRFAQCNLSCQYCDTELEKKEYCTIEGTPGRRDFYRIANPINKEKLFCLLSKYSLEKHHSLSLTGGEPLIQTDFLRNFIPLIKHRGLRILLETNGTLYGQLERVIDHIDIVSMDIKLPSVTGIDPQWEAHYRFLKTACIKDCYVKIVVSDNVDFNDIDVACNLVSAVDGNIPLIIQPLTPNPLKGLSWPLQERLIEIHDRALRVISNVRVIPQTHKMLGQL